ncbi:MAG: Gfo/Idh/MocA family oxidoreductase [Candidatus Latescibacterota bacterium]|jgi:predicted dehydrogenase
MAAAKTRIGILGGGGILGAHLPSFRKVADRCEVVVVAEPDPNRHAAIRDLAGYPVPILPDYAQVLAMPEVEAVDIILPHHLHLPATVAAARAGKHVLTEKVMARNVWECDRMIAACEAAGVTLTVCHDRRYHGEWTALKQIVDSGVLGEIFFWKLDHNQDVVLPPGSWAHWQDGIGGGAIMSCLTHQIDALRWYGGEVASVVCMTNVRPERMQGEFLGVVTAQMRSGALAELSLNWWTRSNRGENRLWYELVQVCGTRGEAYRMDGRGTYIRLHDPADEAALATYGRAALDGFVQVPSGAWGGHERCIAEWVAMLRGEPATILTSGRECRGTVEVAEAAYRSVTSGRRIELPIQPRKWKPLGMPAALTGLTSAREPNYHVDRGAATR